MTPTQRNAMEQALAFCEAWPGYGGIEAADALRNALAEPVPEPVGVVDFINLGAASFQVSRTAVGYIPKIGTKLYAATVHEPAPEPTQRQLETAKRQWESWKGYALELAEKLAKYEGGAPMVLNAAPVREPAPVPLLTQDDMIGIMIATKHAPIGDVIRLTEKVVLQKAGLK